MKLSGMNLIIHHWDTDGICSASIIASILEERGEEWVNASPLPGIFEFDERIWKLADEAVRVFVVDLNMPRSIEKLEKQVIFFDHHLQGRIAKKNVEHVNPVLDGSSHNSYPSATWVVSEYFGKWNYLSALGVVGDLGRKALNVSRVEELLKDRGLAKEDTLRLVALIDSPSVIGDRKGVEDAVRKVKDTIPAALLDDAEWNSNLRKANAEISRVVKDLQVKDSIAYVEFSSKYNIISKVARKMVWDFNYDAAFVVNKNYHGYAQVYLRVKSELAEKFRIQEFIEKLKQSNFNAGGKKEVVGVICESNSLSSVVELVETHLGWENG
jgi:single-stranded DNA-specific DHH superfamily exonuclease